jgi:hypothetical protein
MPRPASCSCGQLSLVAEGDPIRVSVCHCLACQKRTGSVFGAQARFPAAAVAITGTSTAFVRVGDEGHRVTFHFCPTCGATVFYRFDDLPEFVIVPVGAFADPSFPAPKISVYEARRHAWAPIPGDVEHLE